MKNKILFGTCLGIVLSILVIVVIMFYLSSSVTTTAVYSNEEQQETENPRENDYEEYERKVIENRERIIRENGCSYSYDCPNAGSEVALDSTHYVKWECLNGQCVKSKPQLVECTITAECIYKYGLGHFCESGGTKKYTCTKEDEGNSYSVICGDGVCDTLAGEQNSCSEDCGTR